MHVNLLIRGCTNGTSFVNCNGIQSEAKAPREKFAAIKTDGVGMLAQGHNVQLDEKAIMVFIK